ncbi:MAG: PilZ domain-containing protein [Proteobacteria bacterium]|nr:PilZ domain-containing protein [Pseudomonadota bacterium]
MSKVEPRSVNQRNFYRIEYPVIERPRFISDDKKEYEVLDISEKGMRLLKNEDAPLETGSTLQGSVKLHTAGKVNVVGKIIRDTEDSLAVMLHVGIQFSLIINEQQYLQQLNKYID